MLCVMACERAAKNAENSPKSTFLHDSLELQEWTAPIAITPERNTYEEYMNGLGEDGMYVGIFPNSMVTLLEDGSDWKNRMTGVAKMNVVLKELHDLVALESSLHSVVELTLTSLADPHFKVVEMGLELLETAVSRAGPSIVPYLDSIAGSVLDKMGTNKRSLKVAGMKVMRQLMRYAGPQAVVDEVVRSGFGQASSKVREETVNVVTAALLSFPHQQLNVPSLVEDIVPCLGDKKAKVRQASLECVVLLAGLMESKEQLQHLISSIANIERKMAAAGLLVPGSVSLMAAFRARLSREQYPSLGVDGLVEHLVSVADVGGHAFSGPDVDWILGRTVANASLSMGKMHQGTTPRPYRSAKKLPWECDQSAADSTRATTNQAPVLPTAPVTGSNKIVIARSSDGSPQLIHARQPPILTPISHPHVEIDVKQSSLKTPLGLNGFTGTKKGLLLSSTNGNGVKLSANGLADPIGQTGSSSLAATWPAPKFQSNGGSVSTQNGPVVSGTPVSSTPLKALSSSQRPPSKPRVRNPLSSLKPNPAHLSPSQIEKEYLESVGGAEEEYYSTFPEDVVPLNESLTSSMVSMYKELDTPKGAPDNLSHIRRKAASRKAELISATRDESVGDVKSIMSAPSTQKPTKQPKQSTLESAPPQRRADLPYPTNGDCSDPTVHTDLAPTKVKASRLATPKATPTWRKVPPCDPPTEGCGLSGMRDVQPSKKPKKAHEAIKLGFDTTPPDPAPPKLGRPRSSSLPVPPLLPRPLEEKAAIGGSLMELETLDASPPGGVTQFPPLGVHVKDRLSTTKKQQLGGAEDSAPSKPHTLSSKPPLPPVATDSSPMHRPKQRKKPRPPPAPSSISAHPLDDSNSSEDSVLEELHPLPNPEQGVKEALRLLGNEDWNVKCDGLLMVRRMAMYHCEILLPQLHSVVVAAEKEVKNLRSSVSRGAIACIGDLFSLLGRAMEQDLDSLVRTLLHKGGESNSFIREDVEKALGEMEKNVSLARCLMALISGGTSHRSIAVRSMAIQLICRCVERCGPSKVLHASKDVVEKLLTIIVQLVWDAAQEPRYHARVCLTLLSSLPEYESCAKLLSEQRQIKLREALDYLKAKGLGDPPTDSSQAAKQVSGRHPTGGSIRLTSVDSPAPKAGASEPLLLKETKRPKKPRTDHASAPHSIGGGTPALPDRMCDRMVAGDWNERYEAISTLENFVNGRPTALTAHLVKVFDVFTPRLTDRNSKVNLHALEVLSNIIPLVGDVLIPVLHPIINAMGPNLASKNPTIYSTAMTVLDLLVQCIDPASLVQLIVSNAQLGNARVQPIMISKLAELVPLLHRQHPLVVAKHILPALSNLISSKVFASEEGRAAVTSLCEKLYECMGRDGIESTNYLTSQQLEKLRELMGMR